MSNDSNQRPTFKRHRVVVTGMGITSSLGITEEAVWKRLTEGKTGIGTLRSLDTSELKVHIGAEIPEGLIEERLRSLERRPIDRALDLAIVSAENALLQSGLITQGGPYAAQDIPVIFGTGAGPAQSNYNATGTLFEKGPRRLRPTTVPKCMYNAISAGLALQFKLTGPNYMLVSACTSATNAIGTAYRMVRDGYAQKALAGGSDAFFDPFAFGAWNNIGALSRIPDPENACRPFAEDRDGTVLGEGSGSLVLETLESAISRGTQIRGEILGYGESSDATHLTSPSSVGQAKAMNMALRESGLAPKDIGHIHTHGTGTIGNDSCESESIRAVFKDAASDIPIIASKSYFGHTLGASGALECIASLMALENEMAPPNLNIEKPDSKCGLNLGESRPRPIKRAPAMKNSFGFGGGNGVLVLAPKEA